MGMSLYLSFDVGTSGVKACLCSIEYDKTHPELSELKIIEAENAQYPLYIGENGVMEQDAEEIFGAVASTSRAIIAGKGVDPRDIRAICFCGCLIGSVPVDRDGRPLCRAFSFLDSRGKVLLDEESAKPFTFKGIPIRKVMRGLRTALLVPASSKDFIWRIKWLERYAPELQKRLYKWLNYKEYFVLRATGRFIMTEDTAFSTGLYDSRPGRKCFDKKLCEMYGIDPGIFPEVVRSTEIIGGLTQKAALEMGLCPGIPVVAGGNDTSVVSIGAGTVEPGDVNIYTGTCGWVSTVTKKRKVDVSCYMATLTGVQSDSRNLYGQMETAGKALSWARKLIYDENTGRNRMEEDAASVPPGSEGVLFTPWLAGSRAPFSDDGIGAMFYNMHADTTKATLARSAMEGICFQFRWMYECQMKSLRINSRSIRLCGGAAGSSLFCQILADVLGQQIEVPEFPQDSGVAGLCCLSAIATGQLDGFGDIANVVRAERVYKPDPDNRQVYDCMFELYREIYKANKHILNKLNGQKLNYE